MKRIEILLVMIVMLSTVGYGTAYEIKTEMHSLVEEKLRFLGLWKKRAGSHGEIYAI